MTTLLESAKQSSTALRRRAEAQLKIQSQDSKSIPTEKDAKRALHELQVHQIELEMQNEQLQHTQIAERKTSQRYTELFEFAPVAYFVMDQASIINQLNLRAAILLDIDRVNLVGQSFVEHLKAEYKTVFSHCLSTVLEGGGIQTCEIAVQVSKRVVWLSVKINIDDTDTSCLVTMIDISERKLAEDKLKLAANVFSYAGESIMITDATATIIDVNETFTITTGYSREEAIGNNQRMLRSGREPPDFYVDMWQQINTAGHWKGEVLNRRKNGEVYTELLTISAVVNDASRVQHYVALFTDITQIKQHQAQLERIAHFDTLTKLPNRILIADRLSQTMLNCQRHQQSLAVAFLNLDGFKAVNDSHGHTIGDELLISLSERMKLALREGDTLARIGGDEFIAILADLAHAEDCLPVLDRLLEACSSLITVRENAPQVTLMEHELQVSVSIGVSLYPQDDVDTDQLIRHADQAMSLAKQAGKNQYHLFDSIRDNTVKIHRESIGNISSALSRREFVLLYQPKVNMRTGKVIGVEALIRWQHPNLGLLSPVNFLPIIENHAISLELGEWVIDTALTQISLWQNMGLDLPISVNIAAYQLQQDNFAIRLAELLAAHPKVNPSSLNLEVLETSALPDISLVSATMQTCIELGVHFALDDFGTGYSSLTYLRRLPASLIKIDQSFVHDMLTHPDDLAIIEGVIALAKSFKRQVIAEGVETIEHGTALLKLGCELAQGYGIGKPMPTADIPAWVDSWQQDISWKI